MARAAPQENVTIRVVADLVHHIDEGIAVEQFRVVAQNGNPARSMRGAQGFVDRNGHDLVAETPFDLDEDVSGNAAGFPDASTQGPVETREAPSDPSESLFICGWFHRDYNSISPSPPEKRCGS
jgi:hypothetical protein